MGEFSGRRKRPDVSPLRSYQTYLVGRVAGERLLSLEATVAELDLARREEPAAEADADGAVLGGPPVVDQLGRGVDRGDDHPEVEVLVEEVRPGEKRVDVARQRAIPSQGSLGTDFEMQPALVVDQGVRGIDGHREAGGDLGARDVNGGRDKHQTERRDHGRARYKAPPFSRAHPADYPMTVPGDGPTAARGLRWA